MKLVNWNIEWMNNWFVGGNQVAFRQQQTSHGSVKISDVPALAHRVADVIKSFNCDILTVQEGPSDIREMELFNATHLLDDNNQEIFDVYGGNGSGAQKLYALVKKNGAFSNPAIARDDMSVDLEEDWQADVDGDLILEEYGFTRPPLIIDGDFGNHALRVVVLHTKSKYVHNQVSLFNNPATRLEFLQAAMKNRRRISTEGFRLRTYLNDLMEQNNNVKIIVTGDWNDGPGNDYFERNFLTHNVSDIILGSTFYPQYLFSHSFLHRVPLQDLYTAIFNDFIDGINNRKILLDHIVVSPAVVPLINDSGILHNEFDAALDSNAPTDREKAPSDHRPVYIELQ